MAPLFPPLSPFEHGRGRGGYPTTPTFRPLSPYEHGQGHYPTPFAKPAAPVPIPKRTAGPPAPSSNPYAGLFTGSAMDQAQKLAQYLFNPYKQQYDTLTSQHATLNAQRLAQLQQYIQSVANQFTGVPAQVQAAYQTAAQDQSTFAQGFSDAVKGAVQESANTDNQLLSQIGAPSGQNIPDSQATNTGDVVYGLGGWIPASLLASEGAHAYAEAAQIPGLIQQRGLSAVSDLLGQQQDEQSQLDAAYQQALAGQPKQVLDIYDQIKNRQATAVTARQKALADARSAALTEAQNRTVNTGYLWVVTRSGQVKRATDRGGKPILTLAGQKESLAEQKAAAGPGGNPYFVVGSSTAGWTIYDKATGKVMGTKPPATAPPKLTMVNDGQGNLTWYDATTGQPVSQALGAVPVKSAANLQHVVIGTKAYSFDPSTGIYTDPLTGKAVAPLVPAKQQAPHFQKLGNSLVAVWQKPDGSWQSQVVATGPKTRDVVTKYDSHTGVLSAVDRQTGTTVWTNKVGTPQPAGTNRPQLQHVVINGHVLTFDGVTGYFHDPVTHQVIDPNTFRKPGKPVSPTVIKNAWKTISQGKKGWWALQTEPDTPLTPDQFRSAVKDAGYVSVGDFLSAYNRLAPDQQTALEDKIGVQYSYGDPQEIYLGLVHSGVPARRAWTMVRKQWPTWGAGFFKPPKGGAAAEPAAPDSVGGSIVTYARQQLGQPYVWGGESRKEGGFDCSGLVDWALRQEGYTGPRLTTYSLAKMGTSVKGKKLLPGDLIITNGGEHVVIYAGNGKVIAAPHTGTVVQYQPLSNFHIDDARRLTSTFSAAQAPWDPKQAVAPQGARNTARDMAASRYGWKGSQWQALNSLWTKESGFDYKIHNLQGSGAVGIPQAMPSAHDDLPADFLTNPVAQIEWGLRYIKDTYKTPARAWAFWRATVYGNPNLAPKDLRGKAAYWISVGDKGY